MSEPFDNDAAHQAIEIARTIKKAIVASLPQPLLEARRQFYRQRAAAARAKLKAKQAHKAAWLAPKDAQASAIFSMGHLGANR